MLFAGTAQVLVQHGVPAVISMQSEVMDETACSFAEKFYRALAAGLPVDACVGEVRRALAAERNPEWGTPVLYLRAPDGKIFDLVPAVEMLPQTLAPTRSADAARSPGARGRRAGT